MNKLSDGNPVMLLLEKMLDALSGAPENINNERRRRRFLLIWLDSARQMTEFRGMAEEFTALRKLLGTNIDIPVQNTLKTLLENGHNAVGYELYRFRSALATCRSKGWQIGTCAWADQLLSETLARAKTGKCHILQLNSTTEIFSRTGRMIKPVSFSLIHPSSVTGSDVEEIFRDEGFMVVPGRECSLTGNGRNMLSRILHVGHSDLPEAEWGMDCHRRENDTDVTHCI